MNKKFIVFILIFSLILPLFPAMHFTVFAEESVSENDPNPFQNDVMRYFADRLIRDGYVVRDFDDLVAGYLQAFGYISQGTDQLENQIHEFNENVANGVFSIDDVKNDVNIQNSINQYVNDNLAYYIYDFINVNDFFSYYQFIGYPSQSDQLGLNDFKDDLLSLTSDTDFVYFLNQNLQGIYQMQYLYNTNLTKVPRSAFDNVYLTLYSGQFSGIQNYAFQSFRVPRDGSSMPVFNNFLSSELQFFDGLEFSQAVDNIRFYIFKSDPSGNYYGGYENILGVPSYKIFTGFTNNADAYFSSSSTGTAFLYSGQSFSIPVFKSSNLISDFLAGESDVYKFNPSIDIPSGANIDYSRLFEEISHGIAENTGNIIDAINSSANNYLAQQVELLGDINNALNDETGRSWLRRIYSLLEIQFPEVIDAIENIQITGGSADLTQTNAILSQINEKLGFLIDEPFEDMDYSDFESMRDACGRKFPFCIFSDIVAISVILNRPPIEPDINIPIPLGSASMNYVHIDLEPYEYVRPYVHGGIIFLFIIGLLALSVKVFDSVKG